MHKMNNLYNKILDKICNDYNIDINTLQKASKLLIIKNAFERNDIKNEKDLSSTPSTKLRSLAQDLLIKNTHSIPLKQLLISEIIKHVKN